MYLSNTYQAEIDYRRDRAKAQIGERTPRRHRRALRRVAGEQNGAAR